MKEIFYLNKDILPTIPVPHDCVIKDIQIGGQHLTFVFEDDISYHDSIKFIAPEAKSLIIRYHLTDDVCCKRCISSASNTTYSQLICGIMK